MLYTQEAVRANIRNRDGKRVFYLGSGDRLTPGARDFLSRERIEILPAADARPESYRLLSGAHLQDKPESMTHLRGNVLVEKTHPRIRFRGAMDTLEGELLLAQVSTSPKIAAGLGEILELARRVIRCDVLEEPVPEWKLLGLEPEELRSHSHRPQDFYGQPHFMPEKEDGEPLLRVNRARCAARSAELAAAEAFTDRDGRVVREDILRVMNRISSAIWILMIRMKQGE